jgi:hypothetical protein
MERAQKGRQPFETVVAAFEIVPHQGDQLCFQVPVLVSEHKVLLASSSQPPSGPATPANGNEFGRLESKVRASRVFT